jgi:FKBP-type peptidyl-prolyl cis-trans isomerase
VRRLLVLLAAVPLLLLSACGEDPATPGAAPASSATAADPLADIEVTGDVGAEPTVEFPTPLEVAEAASTVLVEGDGEPLAEGQQAQAHLATFDGSTGDKIDSSYEAEAPAGFPMDPNQIRSDLYEALLGVPVGSRVLLALPTAAEGGGSAVVVTDILSAKVVPDRAEGTAVAPAPGLPTVTLAEDGAPTITLPEGEPPAELIVQPLIVGDGPVVEQGQQITVHYTGVTWPGGEVFDSSWQKGSPTQFPIGVGQVIPGWDAGLVGQTVGSQVLLVIPPAEGYGEGGNEAAGISGTDTLVFVVDILDAN